MGLKDFVRKIKAGTIANKYAELKLGEKNSDEILSLSKKAFLDRDFKKAKNLFEYNLIYNPSFANLTNRLSYENFVYSFGDEYKLDPSLSSADYCVKEIKKAIFDDEEEINEKGVVAMLCKLLNSSPVNYNEIYNIIKKVTERKVVSADIEFIECIAMFNVGEFDGLIEKIDRLIETSFDERKEKLSILKGQLLYKLKDDRVLDYVLGLEVSLKYRVLVFEMLLGLECYDKIVDMIEGSEAKIGWLTPHVIYYFAYACNKLEKGDLADEIYRENLIKNFAEGMERDLLQKFYALGSECEELEESEKLSLPFGYVDTFIG